MSSPDLVLDKADPGDDVAARFDYQHSYAAINAIRLITGEGDCIEVICENHEDYLLKNSNEKFIGTQIKTRKIMLPPFKAGETQVTNALGKFCLLDQKFPNCFEGFDFTTNHSFWENEQSQNNLPWLLSSLRQRGGIKGLRENSPLRQYVEGIACNTGLSPQNVSATLIRTTVRGHAAEITHIGSNVQEALCECPGVKELPYATVATIAKALVQLAREASAKALRGPITELFTPGTDLKQAVDDQLLAGKRICRADVLAIIDRFKGGKPYEDINVSTLVTPSDAPSDLVIAFRKLAKGGVEAGRVTNIEDRVRSFEALFLEWSRKYGADEAKKRYSNSDDLPASTVAEEDQTLIGSLSDAIASKTAAIADIEQRLKEQESLIAEFLAMKFKIARSSTASELLKGAAFHACPACGTEVSRKSDGAHCVLCKSDLVEAPGGFESDSAVMERDLSDRIDDLKRSVQRLKRSHDRQNGELGVLTTKRADAQRRMDFTRRQVESEYMKRARRLESRRGEIRERRRLLVRIMGMPGEVEAKLKEADAQSTRISELERNIQIEQRRFEAGRKNVNALEKNFHALLRAIHFPEIKADDKVFLNQRTWFPYVHPKGNESLAWTFSDAGSGGVIAQARSAVVL